MGRHKSKNIEVLTPDREHYVLDNLKLVTHIVVNQMHITPNFYLFEDCLQEGNMGLVLSAIRFKPELGYEFSTYACLMIRGQVLRFLRDFKNQHKYPRTVVNYALKVSQYMQDNECSSYQEAMDAMGVSLRHQAQVVEYLSNITHTSLDMQLEDDEGSGATLSDLIGFEDEDILSFINDDTQIHLERIIDLMLANSSETHKGVYIDYIVDLMYNPEYTYGELTQMQLAKKYKISQAQVSRIIKNYNSKLRDLLS